MQELQQILDYCAIAPILIAVALFAEYCWRRSAARVAPTLPPSAIEAETYSDLLQIAPSPAPVEVPDCALVPLGKLYSVPGSSKWSKSRKLRSGERQAVLAAIAA